MSPAIVSAIVPAESLSDTRGSSGSTGRSLSGSWVRTATRSIPLSSKARSGLSTIGTPATSISALWPVRRLAPGSPFDRDPASSRALQPLMSGQVVVQYDAAMSTQNGVDSRRFTATVPADGTAATVPNALNDAANQVATQVAQWIGG